VQIIIDARAAGDLHAAQAAIHALAQQVVLQTARDFVNGGGYIDDLVSAFANRPNVPSTPENLLNLAGCDCDAAVRTILPLILIILLSGCSSGEHEDDNPFPTRQDYRPGSRVELTEDNLRHFQFRTEADAVFAFGHVYGGRNIEWGATINFDANSGMYYIGRVSTDNLGTQVTIRGIGDTTTAVVHTHPWRSSLNFSDSEIEDAQRRRINDYVIQPQARNSGRSGHDVFKVEICRSTGDVLNDPNRDPSIGNTDDWFDSGNSMRATRRM